ncbi:MAG: hypothetical protein JO323_07675 [Acidobacteriia bacterium]|nr:hypothetical protein [Terriglobia bacterium]
MTTKEHRSKHHRKIAAIRKLIVTGMRMMGRNREQIRENQKQMKELVAAQKLTAAALRTLIETRTN